MARNAQVAKGFFSNLLELLRQEARHTQASHPFKGSDPCGVVTAGQNQLPVGQIGEAGANRDPGVQNE